MAGPNAMQMSALGIVRGTRLTGTVTVSSTPQPASRSPWVMTAAPESTFTVTLGPVFAEAEMRIADVPAGSVPLVWHLLKPPLTYATASWAGTTFVPTTVIGERDSTTPSALAASASPTTSATRTLRTMRAADPGCLAAMGEAYWHEPGSGGFVRPWP